MIRMKRKNLSGAGEEELQDIRQTSTAPLKYGRKLWKPCADPDDQL